MTPRLRLVPALAAALLALTACAAESPTGTGDATEPQRGGTLVYGVPDDFGCMDPQQVSSNDAINMTRPLVASLTSQNPETGEIEPWLATEWEVSDESTHFTFTLLDDATFADGSRIDAEAVVANIDGILALGSASSLGAGYLSGLEAVTATDDFTVTFEFSTPRADFLQATTTQTLGLISVDSTTASQADRCAGNFVGSGPFTLQRYEQDTIAELAGRDDYAWPPASSENQGAPYLDELHFAVIPESSTLTGTLLSNQIQASNNISALDQEIFAERGYELDQRANPGMAYGFLPNFEGDVASDPAVRDAISHGIDREAVVELLTPLDRPATSVLSDTTPYYTDYSDELAYDPEFAEATLDEAGWEVGADGIREKDGQRLTFTIDFWQPTADVLQLVQQQLKQIGVDMQLKQTTLAQQLGTLGDGSRDFWWVNSTRADPSVTQNLLGPNAQFDEHRPTDDIDTRIDRVNQVSDPDERQEATDDLVEQILAEDAVIPVMQLSTTIVSAPGTHGIAFDASSRIDFHSAWMEQN
ncbi:ABC transporter substrate-binding protein [Gulosibacter faecalis]|jgi:peptide/nickel transport system substrate-binding protein|uniref:ABC transporter substrate-binding protein n=1 Tax=Gulosibacter faecalis TaxID=272240 RepID=A0ABW5UZ71_9MICO|nr:ABC transporter substrate-binding protein [Gulosibacter faecalis]